jgi:virginiamycin B lyase
MTTDRSVLSMVLWLGMGVGIVMPAAAQTYTEFPTPSARPFDITSGPDGALWFTDRVNSKIGRITTSGTVTLFSTPTPKSEPYFITKGPDGALWFTENSASQIGRIPTTATPANPQISEFKVPDSPSPEGGFTAGPDGALWYSASTSKIYRISVDGTVTNGSTIALGLGAITIGPDHLLWGARIEDFVTMTVVGTVGKLTFYEVYKPPGCQCLYEKMTAGPDGALWYTANGFNNEPGKIGRITTDGHNTVFTIPTLASTWGITSGPDGALWFTEPDILHPGSGTTAGNKIGRITTDGKITEFTISPNSAPGGITKGPDGALWFAEGFFGKIGRFKP